MAGIGKPRGRGVRKFMPQLREGMPLRRMKLNAREKLAKIRVDHPKLTGAVMSCLLQVYKLRKKFLERAPKNSSALLKRNLILAAFFIKQWSDTTAR